jgi:hypothetical protein
VTNFERRVEEWLKTGGQRYELRRGRYGKKPVVMGFFVEPTSGFEPLTC